MALTLERRYRFSASHRYFRPEWSEEENRRRFGKCANSPGHGHNYRLTIQLAGELNPMTGFVVDLGELDSAVHRLVLDPLDHQHLNAVIPEFAVGRSLPTSENLVLWIRNRLQAGLPAGTSLVSLRVAEDEDLAASWRKSEEPT